MVELTIKVLHAIPLFQDVSSGHESSDSEMCLPPICLDPSLDVSYVTNRLHYNFKKYNPKSVKRSLFHKNNFNLSSSSNEVFPFLNHTKKKSGKTQSSRQVSI